MNVSRGIYRPVEIKWDKITLPLKAGTPISAAGQVANSADAVGLVPDIVGVRPVVAAMNLLVAGDVDLEEVEKEAGITFADECKTALSGINFWKDDGKIDRPAPEDSEDDGGDDTGSVGIFVCKALYNPQETETSLDRTWEEIDQAQRDGNLVIFVDAESTQGDMQIGYLVHTHEKPDVPDEDDDMNYYLATFITSNSDTGDGVVKWVFSADEADGYPLC